MPRHRVVQCLAVAGWMLCAAGSALAAGAAAAPAAAADAQSGQGTPALPPPMPGMQSAPAAHVAHTANQANQANQAGQPRPADQATQANESPQAQPARAAGSMDEGNAAGVRAAVLRGTLGDAQVQASLRPKNPAEDGIEGEYFVFGGKQHILLAGEIDGEALWMEESENGVEVSGQWEGTRKGDVVEGTWQSVDGSVSKPFQLKIMP
ncbi:MAG: hypothetical protein ACRYF5_03395 [Janthinobacterium lividum]